MSKVRVSALAKEVGVPSKVLLERLLEMGEYVKTASSTVEAPVVRRYKEKFPPEAAPEAVEPAKKAAPAKAAAAPATPAADAPAAPAAPTPAP
ncbi:MAG: hypothetical protein GX344_05755, partial [Intrasporangiaceae bacterium]|nr:hypothetical protein [Intrasporangiaceae bacterium]